MSCSRKHCCLRSIRGRDWPIAAAASHGASRRPRKPVPQRHPRSSVPYCGATLGCAVTLPQVSKQWRLVYTSFLEARSRRLHVEPCPRVFPQFEDVFGNRKDSLLLRHALVTPGLSEAIFWCSWYAKATGRATVAVSAVWDIRPFAQYCCIQRGPISRASCELLFFWKKEQTTRMPELDPTEWNTIVFKDIAELLGRRVAELRRVAFDAHAQRPAKRRRPARRL